MFISLETRHYNLFPAHVPSSDVTELKLKVSEFVYILKVEFGGKFEFCYFLKKFPRFPLLCKYIRGKPLLFCFDFRLFQRNQKVFSSMSASFQQFITFVQHYVLVFCQYYQLLCKAQVTGSSTTGECMSSGFYGPFHFERNVLVL